MEQKFKLGEIILVLDDDNFPYKSVYAICKASIDFKLDFNNYVSFIGDTTKHQHQILTPNSYNELLENGVVEELDYKSMCISYD